MTTNYMGKCYQKETRRKLVAIVVPKKFGLFPKGKKLFMKFSLGKIMGPTAPFLRRSTMDFLLRRL